MRILTQEDLKYLFLFNRFTFIFVLHPVYYKPGTSELTIIDGDRARRPMRCLGLVELIYVLFLVTRWVYCIIMYPWDPLGTPLAAAHTIAFSGMLLAAYFVVELNLEIMVMLFNGTFNLNSHWREEKGKMEIKTLNYFCSITNERRVLDSWGL